jgi:hypothetical protein
VSNLPAQREALPTLACDNYSVLGTTLQKILGPKGTKKQENKKNTKKNKTNDKI